MSLNEANLASISASVPPPTFAPKTLDCLLTRIGEGGAPKPVEPSGEVGGVVRFDRESGRAEDTDRRPNAKRLPGFGGSGGGWSSELRVLPVSFRTAGRGAALENNC